MAVFWHENQQTNHKDIFICAFQNKMTSDNFHDMQWSKYLSCSFGVELIETNIIGGTLYVISTPL